MRLYAGNNRYLLWRCERLPRHRSDKIYDKVPFSLALQAGIFIPLTYILQGRTEYWDWVAYFGTQGLQVVDATVRENLGKNATPSQVPGVMALETACNGRAHWGKPHVTVCFLSLVYICRLLICFCTGS